MKVRVRVRIRAGGRAPGHLVTRALIVRCAEARVGGGRLAPDLG